MSKKIESPDPIGDPPETDEPVQEPQGRPGHEKHGHAILTDKQVEEVQAKARKRLHDERVRQAMRDLEERETDRLRMEEGLTPDATPGGEMVDILVDLAPYTDRITLNFNQVYLHGRSYTVPRRVAESLREIMLRSQRHQNDLDGKTLTHFYQKQRATQINGGTGITERAPSRADA